MGPRRRHRQMAARLARLNAADLSRPPTAGPRDWSLPEESDSASGGRVRLLLVTSLVLLAAVAGVAVLHRWAVPSAPQQSEPDSSAAVRAEHSLPPAGVESSPQRLRPVVSPPAGQGGFAFENYTPQGVPVTYDPCRPIHYVVRDKNTPTGGDRLVRQAVAEVANRTGLVFVDDGASTEVPTRPRPAFQPQRYGQRWAPVLIAWSDPSESPDLGGDTTGTGGSSAVTVSAPDGQRVSGYVSGSVTLDAPQLNKEARNGRDDVVRAVIEHELGHVVGLAHVPNSDQLMYPEAQLQVTEFGAGDRRGLAQAGAGPCHPEL